MERLGTNYGGWYVPKNMELNENSATFDMVIDFDDDENAYCEKWNLTGIE